MTIKTRDVWYGQQNRDNYHNLDQKNICVYLLYITALFEIESHDFLEIFPKMNPDIDRYWQDRDEDHADQRRDGHFLRMSLDAQIYNRVGYRYDNRDDQHEPGKNIHTCGLYFYIIGLLVP